MADWLSRRISNTRVAHFTKQTKLARTERHSDAPREPRGIRRVDDQVDDCQKVQLNWRRMKDGLTDHEFATCSL